LQGGGVDQRHQLAQRSTSNLLRRLARKAPAKDGQALEYLLLLVGEQAPRMIEHGPHTALPPTRRQI
jgi:hypothetical protein